MRRRVIIEISSSFQSIGLSPTTLLRHSFEQIEFFSKLARTGVPRLRIEAIGGLIRKEAAIGYNKNDEKKVP